MEKLSVEELEELREKELDERAERDERIKNTISRIKNTISRKGRVGCCRIYSCRGKRQTDQYKKIRRKFYFFCKNQAYYICNTKQAQLRARLCICPAYTV